MKDESQAVPTRHALRKALGGFGETYAAHMLQRKGYEILDRNVRLRYGEIDIVGKEDGEMVFVEVKTRRAGSMLAPEEAISDERISHLEAAISEYLERHSAEGHPYRIEVVAIEIDHSGRVTRHDILKDVGLR